MWPNPEENMAGILSTSTGDSEPVMVKQWRYYNQGKWHTDDPTLTVAGDNNLSVII